MHTRAYPIQLKAGKLSLLISLCIQVFRKNNPQITSVDVFSLQCFTKFRPTFEIKIQKHAFHFYGAVLGQRVWN